MTPQFRRALAAYDANERQRAAVVRSEAEIASWPELLEWWDASSGVVVSGSGVSTWVGRKGNVLVQATDVARPPKLSDGWLSFDGSADYTQMQSQPFPAGAEACELWALVRQDALTADAVTDRRIVSYGGASFNNSRYLTRTIVGGVNRLRAALGDGSGAPAATDGGVDFSGRHVVRGRFEGRPAVAIDGGNLQNGAVTVGATGTARVSIGSSNSGTTHSSGWHGSLRDVLVTKLLTPLQASKLHTFLHAR